MSTSNYYYYYYYYYCYYYYYYYWTKLSFAYLVGSGLSDIFQLKAQLFCIFTKLSFGLEAEPRVVHKQLRKEKYYLQII